MNMCVLILGNLFLQLDNGYNDVDFVRVSSIISVESNDRGAIIYTANQYPDRGGWIPEKNRYMTATEIMDLINSCAG